MECAVFDTYVTKKDGGLMHFDIIVPVGTDSELVFGYGRQYLETKDEGEQPLDAKQCKFCHIEKAEPYVEKAIASNGYYILEMQGC